MNKLVCLLATTTVLFISSRAEACECVFMSRSQQIEWADIILMAEISNVDQAQVSVSPVEVIKGKANQSPIFPIGSTSNCDYFSNPNNLRVGERHLLYLRYQERELKASICSGSSPVIKKAEELEALRKQFNPGIQPLAPEDTPKPARP